MAIVNLPGYPAQIIGTPGQISRSVDPKIITGLNGSQSIIASGLLDLSIITPVNGLTYEPIINGVSYPFIFLSTIAANATLEFAVQFVNAINAGNGYNQLQMFYAFISTSPSIITIQARMPGIALTFQGGQNMSALAATGIVVPTLTQSIAEGAFVFWNTAAGTADNAVIAPTGTLTADMFQLAGITTKPHTRYNSTPLNGFPGVTVAGYSTPQNGFAAYESGSTVPVLQEGIVWMRSAGTITRHTAIQIITSTPAGNTNPLLFQGAVCGAVVPAGCTATPVDRRFCHALNSAEPGQMLEISLDII
jgi:hypothetical protein